jgi:hypothetical protein
VSNYLLFAVLAVGGWLAYQAGYKAGCADECERIRKSYEDTEREAERGMGEGGIQGRQGKAGEDQWPRN